MCIECDETDQSKRSFLKGAAAIVTGSIIGGAGFAQNAKPTIPIALNDPNVIHLPVTFKNGSALIKGYLARPKREGRYPGVIVSHGNPGISEDIKNVAAQIAQLGFVGLAMDWNSRAVDSAKLEQPIEYYMTNAFGNQMLSDTEASIRYLTTQEFVKGNKVGAVGFCGGGYFVLMLSTRSKAITAAVAFYGPPVFYPPRVSALDPKPDLMDVTQKIKIPIQCHYGTADRIIPVEDVEKFKRRLSDSKVNAEYYVYQGAGHAFYDYSRPSAFDPNAAKLAFERMSRFLKKNLKSS